MKRFLVVGATGLIGTALLRQMSQRDDVSATALVRRALPSPIKGVQELVIDFETLAELSLPPFDAVFCCLGATIDVAGSKEAFHHVDRDYVVWSAEAARRAGVKTFLMVSAAGASPASRFFYSRVKAEAEEAVKVLGFASLVIARPSLLLGDRDVLGQPGRSGESFAQRLGRMFGGIIPLAYRPLEDHRLARVLLAYALAAPPGTHILASAELHSR